MNIKRATLDDVDLLAPMLDAYRVFYKQDSDIRACRLFLQQRLGNDESVVFFAQINNTPVGFTQLYRSFSSVSLKPVFILNDLYVDHGHRKKGVGEALLNAAKDHCITKKFKGLALETAKDNPAQKLYERLEWQKDSQCFHYFWTAPIS
ncbi:GNAT family N-acetyltransferase [Spongiimicrobium sp. 3-5]|uniref:GNAT family N-acetyltransferase n=1 Tax=Spongiimicrobium sp. 3-5 TaxID=3332596 RepID=UPI00398082BF